MRKGLQSVLEMGAGMASGGPQRVRLPICGGTIRLTLLFSQEVDESKLEDSGEVGEGAAEGEAKEGDGSGLPAMELGGSKPASGRPSTAGKEHISIQQTKHGR